MKENYYALLVAIFKGCSAEEAFHILATGKTVKEEEDETVKEMVELRKRGYTYQEIGDMYGLPRNTVCAKIGKYRNKVAQLASA